jgi:hypothetical protein
MMLGYPRPIIVPHKLTYPSPDKIPQTFLREIAGAGVMLIWKVRQVAAPSGNFMNPQPSKTADDRLASLLRESRPAPTLPPRFQEAVWRRIERPEQSPPAASWVETVASLLLRPRFALATASALLVMGVLLGSLNGSASARHTAQQRYVATVVMPVAP